MGRKVQTRGGTTIEHSTFTGDIQEITVDINKKTAVVHDGSTVGGFPLAHQGSLETEILDRISNNNDLIASQLASTDAQAIINTDTGNTLSTEVTDRTNADAALSTAIDTEETARLNADSIQNAAIAQEIVDRVASDNTLTANIAAEETARLNADNIQDAALTAEASTRGTADTNLQNNLDAEEISRTDADAALQTSIDNIISNTEPAALDSLTEVVTAFEAADSNLNQAITDLADARAAALGTESSTRAANDIILQNNIDAEESARLTAATAQGVVDANQDAALSTETAARISADTAIQNDINANEAARVSADGVLTANLATEVSARGTADTTLQNNINSEETARIAGDASLLTNINTRVTTVELGTYAGFESAFDTALAL